MQLLNGPNRIWERSSGNEAEMKKMNQMIDWLQQLGENAVHQHRRNMGRKKTVSIGHLEFSTQKDALAYFKEILNRHIPGQRLAGADLNDITALLFNHPRAVDKVSSGIKAIVVDNAKHDEKCFHVIRKDDTRDNFSYKKCISGDPSPFTSFSIACRQTVEDDLHNFKVDYFSETTEHCRKSEVSRN